MSMQRGGAVTAWGQGKYVLVFLLQKVYDASFEANRLAHNVEDDGYTPKVGLRFNRHGIVNCTDPEGIDCYECLYKIIKLQDEVV